MAKWEKPPKHDVELLNEYLEANVKGFSASYDKNHKLQHLEIENMSDEAFATLIADLETRFPQAF